MLGSSDCYVHSPVVAKEAQVLSSHSRYDYNVFLSALVSINCVDLNVVVPRKTKFVAYFGDGTFDLPNLRLVR